MVLPPNAAERVAEAKSSAITMPGPDGWAIWTWLSMPPGSTSLPRRVDDVLGGAEIVAERRDAAAADPDVAGESVGGGRNRAAADDGVEGHDLILGLLYPHPGVAVSAWRRSPPAGRALYRASCSCPRRLALCRAWIWRAAWRAPWRPWSWPRERPRRPERFRSIFAIEASSWTSTLSGSASTETDRRRRRRARLWGRFCVSSISFFFGPRSGRLTGDDLDHVVAGLLGQLAAACEPVDDPARAAL